MAADGFSLSDGAASTRPAIDALRDALPAEALALDLPLATLGRWRIGGPADAVVTPRDVDALRAALMVIARTGVPHVIVGDGSNLLYDDAGFRGVVVRIGRAFGGFSIDADGVVEAGAGLWVPSFVRQVIEAGMAGATHAIGIPGTLGGLVTMNGGSQRHGIGENVVSADVLARDGTLSRIEHADLGYGYRRSALQSGGGIVVSARFRFKAGDRHALRREAIAILAARRAKFPRVRANCGSVFVSDPALYSLIGPPGMAIEKAGLKGTSIGGAQFSPDHANFIVNNGDARSRDVLELIHLARSSVHNLTGIAMDAEVRHLAPNGTMRPAHEVAATLFPDSGQEMPR
ncbi:UDP-N-acetylmuramate dehydrogenase [Sphingomonas gellani]|uniref:UDP-N-acetylenolpyruvoylglucosamine reductase n=1 Tax=Sphingomonas gellani TaxID=1166340 RepID=A0A1H8ICQ4_9SPHN|nr:UDP-N-acetylmuramate dehydrogenase [Sphingomonas gellani]SEN65578.1 UDP-N-acetylmuramate dehydrogenase [Sphingomonas gellani]